MSVDSGKANDEKHTYRLFVQNSGDRRPQLVGEQHGWTWHIQHAGRPHTMVTVDTIGKTATYALAGP